MQASNASVRALLWVICGGSLALWFLQWAAPSLPPLSDGGLSFSQELSNALVLRAATLRAGAVWQCFSYALLHGSWMHLAVNMITLWVTGHTLGRILGAQRLAWLIALGAAAGAAGFLLSILLDPRLSHAMTCVGASAIVAALLGCATTLAPRARLLLLLGPIPVPLRALWLLPILLCWLLAEALFYPSVTAYGAHAAGWLCGLLCGAAWSRHV